MRLLGILKQLLLLTALAALRAPLIGHSNCHGSQRIFGGERLTAGYILQIKHHSIDYPLASGYMAALSLASELWAAWGVNPHIDNLYRTLNR
jgi:hypothetical protein